ncbi:MAG: membrane dipeptidase [Acidobacteria bacterium]|nr:MAG: membrane dipeptidase [Acidobacteriota bacterium]
MLTTRRLLALLLVLGTASAASVGPATARQEDLLARARRLHAQVPLIDGHNDFPWEVREKAGGDLGKLDISQPQPSVHTDLARLRSGGVGAQFWSVYIPATLAGDAAVTATLEQIDIVHRMVRRYPGQLELALTAADIERIHKSGKVASLIGMEGGHSIGNSLGALRMLYQLGARYMTLTHGLNVSWADSATDTPAHDGLTPFGREVIREMNRLGMLVDLSHVSPATMDDVMEGAEAPVIFSHSSARALVDVPRNVPDAVLRKLPSNGGVVMVSFVPDFTSREMAAWAEVEERESKRLTALMLADAGKVKQELAKWRQGNPPPGATLSQVADHIDHVRKVAGIDHVGIGSDFDGITRTPKGLPDVGAFPALTAELLRRGYTDDDVKKVLGLNVLRAMRRAEEVAARLQAARPPSTVKIQDLDR